MRIRKRFPPSSLPSVSLSSDPQLTPSLPLVQLQSPTDSQPSDPPNQPHSDQLTVIGSEKPRWVHHKELVRDEVKDERWSEEEKDNHIISKSSNLGQDSSSTQILPPSDSDQVVERWFEGDKVIPLKKRIVREEANKEKKDKKIKGKMKSKTNKKCARPYTDEKDEEGSEKSKSKSDSSNNKRGSEIMEGSRCSRVNGRGWRCGQQTLVGYSLCEHHLGKGRLRSVSSVRSRAVANSTTRVAPKKPKPEPELEPLMDHVYDDDDDDDRLGMVKARSIRSLLGETDSSSTTGVHVVADDNKSRS